MISLDPLIKKMEEKGITYYQLSYKYGINPRTVQRLRDKESVSMKTFERLCDILHCDLQDIVQFVADKEGE